MIESEREVDRRRQTGPRRQAERETERERERERDAEAKADQEEDIHIVRQREIDTHLE